MNEENNSKYGFILGLSVLSNILQIADFELNINQISNDDLMKHLLKQDNILDTQNKMLEEQTNTYLKNIVEQNEIIIQQNKEIINLLKK